MDRCSLELISNNQVILSKVDHSQSMINVLLIYSLVASLLNEKG